MKGDHKMQLKYSENALLKLMSLLYILEAFLKYRNNQKKDK